VDVAGSDTEFADFFAARVAGLRRLAFTLCGDWHTADDLVQTTFIKLYRHWKRVHGQSVDAYARRILVNSYLSHRRDRRREDVVADVPDRPAIGPDTTPRGDDPLVAALRGLPARQRAVVALRHLEDMSVAEVADVLGMAEGTVKSQAARGVAALRRALGLSAYPERDAPEPTSPAPTRTILGAPAQTRE
jgi:RNA polymerase sigma-70 factor (sigma-E family)